jgi:hypothetical protein
MMLCGVAQAAFCEIIPQDFCGVLSTRKGGNGFHVFGNQIAGFIALQALLEKRLPDPEQTLTDNVIGLNQNPEPRQGVKNEPEPVAVTELYPQIFQVIHVAPASKESSKTHV